MISGTIAAKNADENLLAQLDFLFASNFKSRIQQPAGNTFAASLASSFIFLLVIFLSGCSLWGGLFDPTYHIFLEALVWELLTGYLYLFLWVAWLFISSTGNSAGDVFCLLLVLRMAARSP